MRIAVISDIHANVDALAAVLADIRASDVHHVVCLGDLVGYNTFPRETLGVFRGSEILSVHGNHDLMAIGRLPGDDCGPMARKAIGWTQAVLTGEDRHYLASLPGELRPHRGILCVHSAPGDPVVRLRTLAQFHEQYLRMSQSDPDVRLCFTGHSHVACTMMVTRRGDVVLDDEPDVTIDPQVFYFVNPGSVGYPRDGDYRAAYGILDVEARRLSFRRVDYDPTRVLRENARHGIRLEFGPLIRRSLRSRTRAAVKAVGRVIGGLRRAVAGYW
jgi:predicted phosphodiesterase